MRRASHGLLNADTSRKYLLASRIYGCLLSIVLHQHYFLQSLLQSITIQTKKYLCIQCVSHNKTKFNAML